MGLTTLWDVPKDLVQAVEDLAGENLDRFSPEDLADYIAKRGFPDLFPQWTETQIETSRQEGKIPDLKNWKTMLDEGKTGLDALMNLAAINSFTADQEEMDNRVAGTV